MKEPQYFIYHIGHLAYDRAHNTDLERRALVIFHLAERGELYLTQKRIEFRVFEYRATQAGRRQS